MSVVRAVSIAVTCEAIEALSRDHLKVAVPSGPAIVDLDAVEPVLGPAVAAEGGIVQGSVATGTPTAVVVSRPADGAVSASQAASCASQSCRLRPLEQAHLPGGLDPRRRVDADRLLDAGPGPRAR